MTSATTVLLPPAERTIANGCWSNSSLLLPELWGCFTWAPLPEGLGVSNKVWRAATPALSDAEFAKRQHALRSTVAGIEAEVLGF